MRIALLTDIYTPYVNGVVNHVRLLKEELEAMGHEVWVVAPGGASDEEGDHLLRYRGLPLGSTGFYAGWPLQSELWATLRSVDVLHTHHPFLSGALALAAQRLNGAPIVLTNHTRYDVYSRVYLPNLPPSVTDNTLFAWLRSFCDHCSALIAPSESVAQLMVEWGVRQPITVIPNGIHVERFHGAIPADLTQVGVPPGAVTALYLGRISREKSVLPLLEAFRMVVQRRKDVHLVYVGDGSHLEDLQLAAGEWSLEENVHFAGAVPYADVPRWMAAADIFVTASTSEVHPLVVMEAAAAGLPVVAVRSSGVSDTVIDGVTGLLSDLPDKEFADNVCALAADPVRRRAMSRAALDHGQIYDARTTAETTFSLYLQAVQNRALQS